MKHFNLKTGLTVSVAPKATSEEIDFYKRVYNDTMGTSGHAPDIENRFSVGYAIDLTNMEVALIRKNRGPSFNVGKFNGVGGHIKVGESPVGGIRREAAEEMGIWLPGPGQWQLFHQERRTAVREGTTLYFYCASVPGLRGLVRTMTDEEVVIVNIWDFLEILAKPGPDGLFELGTENSNFVYNLGYLLPMAVTWLQNPQHAYTEG